MPLYTVAVYDHDLEEYVLPAGVPPGPYPLWQLRAVLRQLEEMGYTTRPRCEATSVLVQRVVPGVPLRT
jgi:hypothetical protein